MHFNHGFERFSLDISSSRLSEGVFSIVILCFELKEIQSLLYLYKYSFQNSKEMTTPVSVLLFVPNLIGYARVLLVAASFYLGSQLLEETNNDERQHKLLMAGLCYLGAFTGDLVDGWFARKLNQSSKFGGLLDMLTDRVSTCGLLILLSSVLPDRVLLFCGAAILDIWSHWLHMMSAKGHHKDAQVTTNTTQGFIGFLQSVVDNYYAIYPLFGYCCVTAELYWVLTFAQRFYSHDYFALMETPLMNGCLLKNIINVAQLLIAGYRVAESDVSEIKANVRASKRAYSSSRRR